ncbi:site-specific integrase [Lachnospiraceae bacterium OttesenSCG-928-D06]|nr:site-specific integrase [Lachnospiraceae bacterium OttesenSCG-928-D06]
MRTTDFARYLSAFLTDYLPKQRGVSQNTIRSYRDCFKLLLKYFECEKGVNIDRITLKDIDRKLVLAFLAWLEKERGCSITTRNQRLAAIESYFKYISADNPELLFQTQQIGSIRIKKAPKPVISYLTVDSMRKLLEVIDTSSPQGRRDLAMLSLLYDSGSRVQELIDLRAENVHLGDFPSIDVVGKGNKHRAIPLTEATGKILEKYMEEFRLNLPQTQCNPLFLNKFGNRFTREGITYTLQKYAALASESDPGIPKKITPHILRHTKSMHLIEAGVDLVSIRDFLGHVDLSTTDIYAKTNVEEKRRALEKAGNVITVEMKTWNEDKDLMEFLNTIK